MKDDKKFQIFFKAKDWPKVTDTVTITGRHSWQSCPDLQVLDQLMPVTTECSKNTLSLIAILKRNSDL